MFIKIYNIETAALGFQYSKQTIKLWKKWNIKSEKWNLVKLFSMTKCLCSREILVSLKPYVASLLWFCLQTSQSLFWTQRNLSPQFIKKKNFAIFCRARTWTRIVGSVDKHSTNELLFDWWERDACWTFYT